MLAILCWLRKHNGSKECRCGLQLLQALQPFGHQDGEDRWGPRRAQRCRASWSHGALERYTLW